MTSRQLWEHWRHFWFEMRSPLPVAVFRILLGLHVLMFGVLIYPDLSTWYLPEGILSLQPYREWSGSERFSLLFFLPPTAASVHAVFTILMVSALTFTFGFCTRTSNFFMVLMLVSLHQRNLIMLNPADGLMRLMALYLMFSQAGKALSIDAWLQRRGAQEPLAAPSYAIWAQRLMQLQVVVVYLQGVLLKINGSPWLDGTAVYYVLQLHDYHRLPVSFLLQNLLLLKLMTWGALVTEFCLATLLWVKEFRYYILAAGVALHLGIELTMNIPLLETLMISTYVLFIDPKDIDTVLARCRGLRKAQSAANAVSS